MSAKSPDSVALELGASRALATILVALHSGAFVLAAWLPMPILIRVGILVFVALSLFRGLRLHALRTHDESITGFSLSEEGGCRVRQRVSGDWHEVRVIDQWVHAWVTVLVLRGAGRRWASSVVVAADAAPAEAFRRLRVRLRLQNATV